MMSDINSITMTGRLTRDAEKKVVNTGTTLITFDIANNTGFGEYERVLYVKINLWGKTGEKLHQYLTKGKLIGITGQLQEDKWTDQSGVEKKKILITANNNGIVLLPQTRPEGTVNPIPSHFNDNEDVVF
jgi:single-strand DNA-binding protein